MTDIEEILKATRKWTSTRIQLLSYTNDLRNVTYTKSLYDYLKIYIGTNTQELRIKGSVKEKEIDESINRYELGFIKYEEKATEIFEKAGNIIFESIMFNKEDILDIDVISNVDSNRYVRYLETMAKMMYNQHYYNKYCIKISTRIPSLVKTIMQIQMAYTNEHFEGKIYAPGKVIEINF